MKRSLSRLITARVQQLTGSFNDMTAMEQYAEETVSAVYYLLLQAAGIHIINLSYFSE
jgi:hypothetical protein